MDEFILSKSEDKILNFLKKSKEEYINMKDIEISTGLTYPTVRNACRVLEAIKIINVIEKGNNKFIKVFNA